MLKVNSFEQDLQLAGRMRQTTEVATDYLAEMFLPDAGDAEVRSNSVFANTSRGAFAFRAQQYGPSGAWKLRSAQTTLTIFGTSAEVYGIPLAATTSIATEPFEVGAAGLIAKLESFRDHDEASESVIQRTLDFMERVWYRLSPRRRQRLNDSFCGMADDGSVNFQWRYNDVFLGLSVPDDPQLPLDSFFEDDRIGTKSEWEGAPSPVQAAEWLTTILV